MSHAVVWTESNLRFAGRLELTTEAVVLTGTAFSMAETVRELRYRDLVTVQIERRAPADLTAEPELVLLTCDGTRIAIRSLEGPGALHELTDEVGWACERSRHVALPRRRDAPAEPARRGAPSPR